jgi:hypothetical protein
MVARVRLFVDIEQFVPRTHHKRRPQLHRTLARVALPVPTEQRSSPSDPCVGPYERRGIELVHLDDSGSLPILIKEDWEGHILVLDEGLCIPFASGAERCDISTGRKYFLVPLTDLTGPFPARQSAKVTQEEKYMALIGPQITEAVRSALRIGQRYFSEFGHGWHARESLQSCESPAIS